MSSSVGVGGGERTGAIVVSPLARADTAAGMARLAQGFASRGREAPRSLLEALYAGRYASAAEAEWVGGVVADDVEAASTRGGTADAWFEHQMRIVTGHGFDEPYLFLVAPALLRHVSTAAFASLSAESTSLYLQCCRLFRLPGVPALEAVADAADIPAPSVFTAPAFVIDTELAVVRDRFPRLYGDYTVRRIRESMAVDGALRRYCLAADPCVALVELARCERPGAFLQAMADGGVAPDTLVRVRSPFPDSGVTEAVPFELAAGHGNAPLLRALIDAHPAAWARYTRSDSVVGALYLAAASGSADAARVLLHSVPRAEGHAKAREALVRRAFAWVDPATGEDAVSLCARRGYADVMRVYFEHRWCVVSQRALRAVVEAVFPLTSVGRGRRMHANFLYAACMRATWPSIVAAGVLARLDHFAACSRKEFCYFISKLEARGVARRSTVQGHIYSSEGLVNLHALIHLTGC